MLYVALTGVVLAIAFVIGLSFSKGQGRLTHGTMTAADAAAAQAALEENAKQLSWATAHGDKKAVLALLKKQDELMAKGATLHGHNVPVEQR